MLMPPQLTQADRTSKDSKNQYPEASGIWIQSLMLQTAQSRSFSYTFGRNVGITRTLGALVLLFGVGGGGERGHGSGTPSKELWD